MIRKFSSLFLLSFRRQGPASRKRDFTAGVSLWKRSLSGIQVRKSVVFNRRTPASCFKKYSFGGEFTTVLQNGILRYMPMIKLLYVVIVKISFFQKA
jgi:hypothetical protein